jgi:Resolvase, N terminal domain
MLILTEAAKSCRTAGKSASWPRRALSFDLSTSNGNHIMRTIMAGLTEFERDLIRERVKSGLASARARGVKLGRQPGQRPSDNRRRKRSPFARRAVLPTDGPQSRAQQEYGHGDRQARSGATFLAVVQHANRDRGARAAAAPCSIGCRKRRTSQRHPDLCCLTQAKGVGQKASSSCFATCVGKFWISSSR